MNFPHIALFIALFTSDSMVAATIEGLKAPQSLSPSKSVSGMFDPFKEALTCNILISQNMIYTSGQVEDLCRTAYDNCIIQGLLKGEIANTKSDADLPVGATLKDLQNDLTYSDRLVIFYLRGCQLAIKATYGGTRELSTQTLQEAAGY